MGAGELGSARQLPLERGLLSGSIGRLPCWELNLHRDVPSIIQEDRDRLWLRSGSKAFSGWMEGLLSADSRHLVKPGRLDGGGGVSELPE